MNNLVLDKDGNFSVQESVLLNYIVAFISLAIFFGVLATRNFERNYALGSFHLLYVFLLVSIVIPFIRVKRRKFILMVNSNGMYFKGKFITGWQNFIDAYIMQEDYSDGVNDRFNIVVTFFEPVANTNYSYTIAMSATQNKSEYEIISAIEYFSEKKLSFDVAW